MRAHWGGGGVCGPEGVGQYGYIPPVFIFFIPCYSVLMTLSDLRQFYRSLACRLAIWLLSSEYAAPELKTALHHLQRELQDMRWKYRREKARADIVETRLEARNREMNG